MHPSIFTALGVFAIATGFNIITPRSGEVIDVDQLYNLTWTVDDVPPNFIVSSIQVQFPGVAMVGPDEYYYLQGFGDDDSFDISGDDGFYQLNLSRWWSPLYDELQHGSWSMFLELYDLGLRIPALTALNDSVSVQLTSSKKKQDIRPQLASLADLSIGAGTSASTRSNRAMGIVSVTLSVAIPILLFGVIVVLARHRWQRHSRKTSETQYSVLPGDGQDSNTGVIMISPNDEAPTSATKSAATSGVPWKFVASACIAILPLVALLAALISLLLIYRVEPSSHSRADFAFNESGSDPIAFFVDFDATQYTTVASWTSSIALLLPGFLTTLIWYKQSEQLRSDTKSSCHERLLTPYQLALLLGLKSGTLGSLWEFLSYAKSRRREKQSKFLSHTGFVVLISTLLGLGIWMADTWLHVASSTVPFTSSSRSGPIHDPMETFGRSLTPNCTSTSPYFSGDTHSCIIEPVLADVPPYLIDPVQFVAVMSGRDTESDIFTTTIGEERVAYIGPKIIQTYTDYRANTYAFRSTCQTIDEWCYMLPYNDSSVLTSYPPTLDARCGDFVGIPSGWPNSTDPVAQGTIVAGGNFALVTSFFTDQNWTTVMTVNNTKNTFYTVSRIDSPIAPSQYALPAYWSQKSGSFPIYNTFIGCSSELVNFTYTYVNGSVRSAEMTPINNLDLMNAIYLPTLYNFDPFLTSGAATTATADDREYALENWMDTWHRHYLSLAALAVEQVDNLDQQERHSRLVARIPKAPVLTLGVLLLLSILFNAWVLFHSLRRTNLKATQPKQEIISIAGLAASAFDKNVTDHGEPVSDAWNLFEESKEDKMSARVGIGENPVGGHRFVAFAVGVRDSSTEGVETVKSEAVVRGREMAESLFEDSARGCNAI